MNRKAKLFRLRYAFMDLGRLLCAPVLLHYRIKKHYLGGKPKDLYRGPKIIAANHTSFSDPIAFGTAFWMRRTWIMAADVMAQNPVQRFFMKGIGCIFVSRDAVMDTQSMEQALSVLREGHCLLIFPQGQLCRDGVIDKLKGGAALLAQQAGVPVIPIYTERRTSWFRRRSMVIGQPVDCGTCPPGTYPKGTEIRENTARLLQALQDCKAEFHRKSK